MRLTVVRHTYTYERHAPSIPIRTLALMAVPFWAITAGLVGYWAVKF